MAATLLKTILFTLVAPGTVTVVIPFLMLRATHHAIWMTWNFATALGSVMILLGAATYLMCAWSFVFAGRGTPAPIDPPKALVVQGLYRWSRNPMYVGIVSILLGETIFFRSTALLIYTIAVFVGFNVFIMAYEEPTLARLFGDSYARYRDRVPRWIGAVRGDH